MEKVPHARHTHSRSAPVMACAVALAFLSLAPPRPAPAANIITTWDGATGDWFDPAHWSTGIPANAADSYLPIVNAGTLTLAANLTTSGLTLAAPTLLTIASGNTYNILSSFSGNSSIAGQILLQSSSFLDVQDSVLLTSASISGTGTYRQLAGTLSLAGASSVSNFVVDQNANIVGSGTITITHHADLLSFQSITNNATFIIPSTASLTINNTNASTWLLGRFLLSGSTNILGSASYTGNGFISNSNLLTIGADGLAPIVSPGTLTNTGTLNLASGTLSPTVSMLGGLVTLGAAATYKINGGTLTNGAVLTSAGGSFQAGSFLTIAGNATVDHFTFGGLFGTGTLTLLGSNSWSSFGTSVSQLINDKNATLLATGSAALGGGTLTNNGTLLLGYWPGDNQAISTNLGMSFATRLVNTGTVDVDGSIGGGGATISNSGLITIANAASTALRSIGTPVINSGTISGLFSLGTVTSSGVISGTNTLSFLNNSGLFTGTGTVTGSAFNSGTISGQITLTTGSSSGMISADSVLGGTTLTISGGFTLTQGALVSSNLGTVSFTGALTTLGQVSARNILFNGVTNSGSLTLDGSSTWAAGTMANGTLINNGTLTAGLGGAGVVLSNAKLQNNGVLTLPAGGIQNSGTGTIYNSGLINATGTETIAAFLYNSGTVTTAGKSLSISAAASASGTFIASSVASSITFGGPSSYLLNNATLLGPGLFAGLIQVAGSVTVTNAAFSAISGTGSLNVSGNLSLPPVGSTGVNIINAQVRVLPAGSMTGIGSGFTLTNAGLILQGTSGSLTNTIIFAGSSTLANQGSLASGFGQVTLNQSSANPGSSQFANSGTFTVSSGNFTCNIPFFNTGTITVGMNSATFSAGGIGSGTFIAQGPVGGGIGFTSAYTLDGATLIQPANNPTVGLRIGGIIKLLDQNAADYFSVGQGTSVSGPGTLTVSNALTIFGNSTTLVAVGSGARLTIAPAGILTLSKGTFPADIDAASVLNFGSMAIATTAGNPSLLKLTNGGTLTNLGNLNYNGSTQPISFSIDADASTQNAFINAGIMSWTQSSGSIGINAPFYNTGTLSLLLPQGPLVSNLQFNISGGGSASGLIQMPAASIFGINFNCPYTLSNATLSGNISFSGPLTLQNNVRTFGAAYFGGTTGPGTLSGGSFGWLANTLSNAGGITIDTPGSGNFYYAPAATASAYASLVIRDDTPTPNTKALDGTSLTLNAGLTGAWGTAFGLFKSVDQITFKNGARIVNNGTFYTYIGGAAFATDNHSANAFINTGTFGRSSLTLAGPTASANTTTFHIPFHNSGLIDIQQGRIDFAAGYFDDNPITGNTAKFKFAPGTGLYFSGGTYDFGDAPFDLGPGGLFGTGTVHAHFISGGTISPGNSPGNLTITGDLALTSAATLNIEISYAGTIPQFDTLTVLGNFSAAGTLNLTLLAGTPDATLLPLIAANHFTGIFDNLPDGSRILDSGSDGSFLVTYSPQGLTLSDFQATPEPLTLTTFTPALLALLLRRRARTHTRS